VVPRQARVDHRHRRWRVRAGALITAPVANRLIDSNDVAQVFLVLGLGYLVMILVGASFFRNPPAGYAVPGFEASKAKVVGTADEYTLGQALRTPSGTG
jgi:OFA family oxalate/formate antiporter-like MFS transporter